MLYLVVLVNGTVGCSADEELRIRSFLLKSDGKEVIQDDPEGSGCHPWRPEQAEEMSPWKSHEVSQGQVLVLYLGQGNPWCQSRMGGLLPDIKGEKTLQQCKCSKMKTRPLFGSFQVSHWSWAQPVLDFINLTS